MELNSILLYVTSPHVSADFYRKLGGEITKETDTVCEVKLGEITLQCYDKATLHFSGDSAVEPKGAGVFMYLLVDDVDATYQQLLADELHPASPPRDWEWGNREFVIKDPDGYKFIIYHPIAK